MAVPMFPTSSRCYMLGYTLGIFDLIFLWISCFRVIIALTMFWSLSNILCAKRCSVFITMFCNGSVFRFQISILLLWAYAYPRFFVDYMSLLLSRFDFFMTCNEKILGQIINSQRQHAQVSLFIYFLWIYAYSSISWNSSSIWWSFGCSLVVITCYVLGWFVSTFCLVQRCLRFYDL